MALFNKTESYNLAKSLKSAKSVLQPEFVSAIEGLIAENAQLKKDNVQLRKGIIPKESVVPASSYRLSNGNLNITLKTLDSLVSAGIVVKYDIAQDGRGDWHPTQRYNGEKVWYNSDKLYAQMSAKLQEQGYSLVDIYAVQSSDKSSWNTTVQNGTFKEDKNNNYAIGFFTYKNKSGKLQLSSLGSLDDWFHGVQDCSQHALFYSACYGARNPVWLGAGLPSRER